MCCGSPYESAHHRCSKLTEFAMLLFWHGAIDNKGWSVWIERSLDGGRSWERIGIWSPQCCHAQCHVSSTLRFS